MVAENRVVTPVPADQPDGLSMVEIQALKSGLEEAIQLCLRGEATSVVIVASRPNSPKAWQAGRDGMAVSTRCQMALVNKDREAERRRLVEDPLVGPGARTH